MFRSTDSLLTRQLLPLWLGLILVLVVPFMSIYRVGPLNSYFLEAGSLFGVLLFTVFTLFSRVSGSLNVGLPPAGQYFLLLALVWAAQARLMGLVYVGLSDMVAWSFVILALGAWAARMWVVRLGAENVLSVLAAVLLLGCLLQGAVGWLQYTDVAAKWTGYLMYRANIVEGQLAQRNHFGHYMMWGMLCAAWLWSQRRLPAWAALAAMVFMASVMALTGSRTIFAYVLALAVLIPAAGWISGSLKTRTAAALAFAAALVLAFQFGLEPVLNLFHNDVHSAAERLSGSQFGGSGRGYEWQKAWQIFLSAPWFGHGWGSYSLQGFLVDVYPTGFRPYEGNVLFTHSHNSLLNLLAEMGLAGTGLVLGGLAYALSGCLKKSHGAAGLFVLSLVSVSLVHSFLEYPLWYIYFLSAFALIVGFAPPAKRADEIPRVQQPLKIVALGAVSLVLMVGIVRLSFVYQQLRQFSGSHDVSLDKRAKNIVGLLTIAKTEPMFRYYAQLQLMNYFDATNSQVPDWAEESAREALTYRPYANAYKWGLVAARTGQPQVAREWMQAMYRYYPTKFQAYGNAIMRSNDYIDLQADYTRTCYAYYATRQQLPECTKAVSVEP